MFGTIIVLYTLLPKTNSSLQSNTDKDGKSTISRVDVVGMLTSDTSHQTKNGTDTVFIKEFVKTPIAGNQIAEDVKTINHLQSSYDSLQKVNLELKDNLTQSNQRLYAQVENLNAQLAALTTSSLKSNKSYNYPFRIYELDTNNFRFETFGSTTYPREFLMISPGLILFLQINSCI